MNDKSVNLTNLKSGNNRRLINRVLKLFAAFIMALSFASIYVAPRSDAAPSLTVTARTTEEFVNSIGVNIHAHYDYGGSPWNNRDAWVALLRDSGIRHVRDGITQNDWSGAKQKLAFDALDANGIKLNLIVDPKNGHPNNGDPPATVQSLLAWVKARYPKPESFEGINEVDSIYMGNGEPGWEVRARLTQKALYESVRDDAYYQDVKVVGPSLVNSESYAVLDDISAYVHFGNVHPYPGGGRPEENLAGELDKQSVITGSKPVYSTETGYPNHITTPNNWPYEHGPTPEDVAAVYTPRLFLESFRRGIARVYFYELLNENFNDGDQTNIENTYGLVRADYTVKPAYTAIKNLTALLADSNANFTPGSLEFALTGANAQTKQVLLQKSDNSFWLAVWQETEIWDRATRTRRDPLDAQISLTLGQNALTINRYQPNTGINALESVENTNTLVFTSSEVATLIEIKPALTNPTVPVANGIYKLTAKHSGKALDVSENSQDNGAVIHQYDYLGYDNQKWVVEALGDGTYKLIAKHSGKALDVCGGFDEGGCVTQYDYWGGDNQRWRLEAAGNGYYRVIAKHSGKALDVSNNSSENGAPVIQWTNSGAENQLWKLERLQTPD